MFRQIHTLEVRWICDNVPTKNYLWSQKNIWPMIRQNFTSEASRILTYAPPNIYLRSYKHLWPMFLQKFTWEVRRVCDQCFAKYLPEKTYKTNKRQTFTTWESIRFCGQCPSKYLPEKPDEFVTNVPTNLYPRIKMCLWTMFRQICTWEARIICGQCLH